MVNFQFERDRRVPRDDLINSGKQPRAITFGVKELESGASRFMLCKCQKRHMTCFLVDSDLQSVSLRPAHALEDLRSVSRLFPITTFS